MGLKKKIKIFILRKSSKILINFIIRTCRRTISGKNTIKKIREAGKPVIYIFWHRHIFYNIFQFKNTKARPLISNSHDGEIVSQIAEEFGMNPVRGSSSHGGAKAFLQMINAIKTKNSEIMITADGPKGPAREIKDGTILIAKKSGAALVPVSWYSSGVKIFEKSWDKFLIPKPFSRIFFTYGDPIFVPANITKEDYKKYKKEIKSGLDDLEKNIISTVVNSRYKRRRE